MWEGCESLGKGNLGERFEALAGDWLIMSQPSEVTGPQGRILSICIKMATGRGQMSSFLSRPHI